MPGSGEAGHGLLPDAAALAADGAAVGVFRRRQGRGYGGGGVKGVAALRQAPAQGRQQQGEAVQRPLVGVDAAGGGQHGMLRLPAQALQLPGRGPGHAPGGKLPEIRRQGPGAAVKQGAVHVVMGPGVAPVHQAGLGGQVHLVLQGLTGQGGQMPGGKVRQDIPGPCPDGGKAVGPAAGAYRHRPAADQAPAALGPGQLLPLRGQHVQVVQAAHRLPLLQQKAALLHPGGWAVIDQQGLGAGGGLDELPVHRLAQVPVQRRKARLKGQADQGGVLHGTGDIHGKGQQGPAVSGGQRPLAQDPAVTGKEHLLQSDLDSMHRSSPAPGVGAPPGGPGAAADAPGWR